MKSTELQQQINELDQLIQQGAADAQLNLWEMQRKDLNDQLQVALAEEASQQERVQAQTEMVESITLPLDFNDLLENPLANEMVIEVVKQFQRQAYDEHNAEIVRINAEWNNTTKSIGASAQEMTHELQSQILVLELRLADEKEQAQKDAIELNALTQQVAQLGLEKQDAESKRDAAVRELTEANAVIEKQMQATTENWELRQQIEALKQELTAKKALTVNGSDKLSELANKAKESTIAKANRGLERWNEQYGLDIPVLAIPELEPVTEVVEPVKEIPFQETVEDTNSQGDTADVRNESVEQVVAEESEVVTRTELKKRLSDFRNEMLTELESNYGLVRGEVA